jgi:hypothetical protein
MTAEARQRLEGPVNQAAAGLNGWTPRQVIAHVTMGGGDQFGAFLGQAISAKKLEVTPGTMPDLPNISSLSEPEMKDLISRWQANTLKVVEGLSDDQLATVIETPFGNFPAEQLVGMFAGFHAQDHANQLNAIASS